MPVARQWRRRASWRLQHSLLGHVCPSVEVQAGTATTTANTTHVCCLLIRQAGRNLRPPAGARAAEQGERDLPRAAEDAGWRRRQQAAQARCDLCSGCGGKLVRSFVRVLLPLM
eukprot:scaffold23577_cov60-Phaeocystis_antarctica.AAC.1